MNIKKEKTVSVAGGYLYHPMHMHLHSCHQPGASMEGHIYNAASLGMNYIRFTDHDVRTGEKKYPVKGFDFSQGTLKIVESENRFFGWEAADMPDSRSMPEVSFGSSGAVLRSVSDTDGWTTRGLRFVSSGNRHTVSLLAEVCLKLKLTCKPGEGARLLLDVKLSQRPPEHTPARLIYVLGAQTLREQPENLPPHSAVIALASDGEITLALSSDAVKYDVGGLDNVFDTISVLLQTRGTGELSCGIERFEIISGDGFDRAVQRQRIVADKIGAKYGVKPFVTTEISDAGPHKNCYSTRVPVIDYAAYQYRVTQEAAIAHIKKHGGIFSYNHPFESFKRLAVPPEQKDALIRREAAKLIESKVYGAALIEIGFCETRNQFTLADHLKLWDLLSLGGVFITGYGDSDSHDNRVGWFSGNNFAAWIAAVSDTFPIPEEEFIASMLAGRLYTGDPVRLSGKVGFMTADGAQMGAVIPVDASRTALDVVFTAEVASGWTFRRIIDGAVSEERTLDGGEFRREYKLPSSGTVSFARNELYDRTGRCVMLTNPIYYVRPDEYAGELPKERLSGSAVPRKKTEG